MKKFRSILFIITICCLASLFASPVRATELYAEKTGLKCEVCHIDPMGGGELTEFGKGYLLSVSPEKTQTNKTQRFSSRFIRFIALYIHIVTAFLWFGTILYVHLVLKPSYASKGLPSGEVKVGFVSMFVMAVTGVVLTCYKFSSLNQLFSSRFGILLLIKIFIFTVMVISAVFVVFVIGPKLKKKASLQTASSGNLTPDELSNFDGEEGRPAYFAYKGKIYDVSQSRFWRKGNHMKRHQAGGDLTEMIAQAPHGEENVLSMPEVGVLSMMESKTDEEMPKKVFYFVAYMNLGLVFVIALILALWRW